jgi:HEPN domain-containing protein
MDNIENNSWLEYALNDFEAALILAKQHKPKVEIVCYHCQQSAEKMLKGFIATNNGKLIKTHDLVVLCEACINYEAEFDLLLETCSDLTIYASEIRYTNILEIDEFQMRKAINDANKIKDFVQNKIIKNSKL